MHRTLERGRFVVSDVAPGEVLVASTFTHPVRGVVECPAAPVAATAMGMTGLRVRRRSAPPVGSGDGILHAVSYVDPSGQVMGLGVVAPQSHGPASRLAEEVVRSWAGVMRTRRVLVEATGPSCAGLRREAAMLAKITGPAYTLATGRRHVPVPWTRHDVRLVEQVADVPDGATVVVPAHGVDQRTRAECAARGLRIVDATCSLVARTHATAQRFAEDGSAVVVIGNNGHAAVPPIVGQVAGDVAVVDTVDEVDDLVIDTREGVAFVLSPGLAVEDATAVAARLRSRFTLTRGQHPNEYCHAASDRRAAVRAVASCSDLTLVLGDPADHDTHDLIGTAAATGGTVKQLDELAGLRPEWLGPASSVGVVLAVSARPDLPGELIEVLSGLGPLSVTRRQVVTDVEPATSTRTSARRAG
jgi:4-hydroxy-3-methylbut-2-enyl diphosphate reductase